MNQKNAPSGSGPERRKAKRRPVLESFALAVVVPKKGLYRLAVHDLSDLGMYFDLELEGEEQAGFQIAVGEELMIHLYLNSSLFLPLTVKVKRLEERETGRRVGVEFPGSASKAYLAFLKMLDEIIEYAELTNS